MWAVIDLETTVQIAYKRKANPFLRNEDGGYVNYTVLMGWCTRDSPDPECIRMTRDSQHLQTAQFVKLLEGIQILVGFNLKFDLHHILRDPVAYRAWQDWVAQGGVVFDCQLAEYLLQGQIRESHMLSLDDCCRYYDLDTKVDEVKMLWEAGVDTVDIDPDLLQRYLIGETLPSGRRREGDIGNTRDVFLKQSARIKAAGLSQVMKMNMLALVCSIEMEFNGAYVDKERGLLVAEVLAKSLEDLNAELKSHLPSDIPFDFNFGNRYHLSPLLFGGRVNYKRRQYDLKDGSKTFVPPSDSGNKDYVYSQKDEVHYILEDGSTMECLLWEHCYNTEYGFADDGGKARVYYKSGKNAGEFKVKRVKVDDYSKPKSRMADTTYEFPGYAKPKDEWASSTAGLYSVAAEVITELCNTHKHVPFIDKLGKVAALAKDLGTYYISTDERGEQKGMLTLVMPDGIVHHSLNHTSTVTGRFSASNPNTQNIPKGQKSAVKELFTSRFGDDGMIISSDFSSLEVYVQANLTRCHALKAALLSGTDMHCLRLSKKERMDYNEVLKLCKGYTDDQGVEHPAIPEWDYKRTTAKTFSFQLAYGAGAATIAASTGMSVEEVESLMQVEAELFPETMTYFDELGDIIERSAKPTSQYVGHPENPAVSVQLRLSRVTVPTGKLYSFKSSPSTLRALRRGIRDSFSPTERKNYPVQGEGAEIMKAAMRLLVLEFYQRHNFNGKALLVNTVHDAVYVDCHKDVLEEVTVLVHACMEAATDIYCYALLKPADYWEVPVPSDTTYGSSMAIEDKPAIENFAEKVLAERNRIQRKHYPEYCNHYQTN